MIDTELSAAPANCLNGDTYSWFMDRSEQGEVLTFDEAAEQLTPIGQFDLLQVPPEAILRIAELAKSSLSSITLTTAPRESRIWSLNENDETIFLGLDN